MPSFSRTRQRGVIHGIGDRLDPGQEEAGERPAQDGTRSSPASAKA